MDMIPKKWLTKKVTREYIESLSRLDFLKDKLPAILPNAEVVDKAPWWQEPKFHNDSQWLAFIADYQAGDELWEYDHTPVRGSVWMNSTGISGYALVRNGEVIGTMITGV